MAPETSALPPRYADPEFIGRGGMADVYVAEDVELERKVVVKVLADRAAGGEDVRRRFKREATAAARLSGEPHVVTIFDVGEWEGRPFIVMELVEGGTLADRLAAGPVPPEQALAWLEQAAAALDAAHAKGIVHRDVKPANLLLDPQGQLYIADFGIARILDEASPDETLTGTVLGTVGYLSPEQANGGRAGGRAAGGRRRRTADGGDVSATAAATETSGASARSGPVAASRRRDRLDGADRRRQGTRRELRSGDPPKPASPARYPHAGTSAAPSGADPSGRARQGQEGKAQGEARQRQTERPRAERRRASSSSYSAAAASSSAAASPAAPAAGCAASSSTWISGCSAGVSIPPSSSKIQKSRPMTGTATL